MGDARADRLHLHKSRSERVPGCLRVTAKVSADHLIGTQHGLMARLNLRHAECRMDQKAEQLMMWIAARKNTQFRTFGLVRNDNGGTHDL